MEKFLEATYLDYCVLFKENKEIKKVFLKHYLQQKNFFYALKNRS